MFGKVFKTFSFPRNRKFLYLTIALSEYFSSYVLSGIYNKKISNCYLFCVRKKIGPQIKFFQYVQFSICIKRLSL